MNAQPQPNPPADLVSPLPREVIERCAHTDSTHGFATCPRLDVPPTTEKNTKP